jgi:hypothetical protein
LHQRKSGGTKGRAARARKGEVMNWKYILLFGALTVALLADIVLGRFNSDTKPQPKVDTCPHYVTLKTVETRYAGAWTGDITTLTDTDGATYHGRDGKTYWIGEKICVDQI